MSRVHVVVPPGKEIHVRVGNYKFGPGVYVMDSSIKWPLVYTDGTPINVFEEPVPDVGSERSVLPSEVSGSDDSGEVATELRGDDPVSEHTGEGEQPKKIRRKPRQGSEFRSGISEDSEVQPFSTDSANEVD